MDRAKAFISSRHDTPAIINIGQISLHKMDGALIGGQFRRQGLAAFGAAPANNDAGGSALENRRTKASPNPCVLPVTMAYLPAREDLSVIQRLLV
jgi:hypothetical protein